MGASIGLHPTKPFSGAAVIACNAITMKKCLFPRNFCHVNLKETHCMSFPVGFLLVKLVFAHRFCWSW